MKIVAYLKPEEPLRAPGIKSPIYTDNCATLAYPETRTLIEMVLSKGSGGISRCRSHMLNWYSRPHGAIIADKMNLPFAYIRSKPKDHGAGNQIEGRVAPGQKMVVIEDLIQLAVRS